MGRKALRKILVFATAFTLAPFVYFWIHPVDTLAFRYFLVACWAIAAVGGVSMALWNGEGE